MGLFAKIKSTFQKKESSIVNKLEDNSEVKKYELGLSKTRNDFVSKLINLTNKYNEITEKFFLDLEELLIMADIGIPTVMSFMDRLRKRVRDEKINDPKLLKEIIVDELFIIYVNEDIIVNKINFNKNGPTVILFVGVNGVGKTTTIAKLAKKFKNDKKSVLLIAGDTFRAGAYEQLLEWSKKIGCKFYGKEGSLDPSSVIYDGITKSLTEKDDVIMIDTAGRLQNKVNLMNELSKINKVIGNLIPNAPHETLLVIDATTGQNGVIQAKEFKSITNVTGIVLTKLDGTAKGGIVLAIKEELNIPVKFVGLGEKEDDLETFDIDKYIYGLFKGMI